MFRRLGLARTMAAVIQQVALAVHPLTPPEEPLPPGPLPPPPPRAIAALADRRLRAEASILQQTYPDHPMTFKSDGATVVWRRRVQVLLTIPPGYPHERPKCFLVNARHLSLPLRDSGTPLAAGPSPFPSLSRPTPPHTASEAVMRRA